MYVTLLIILSVALTISLLFIVRFIINIRSLDKQLRFIMNNRTNKNIIINSRMRSFENLARDLTLMITSFREKETDTIHKDQEFRDIIVNLSHDIRTPLTALSGYFDLLCDSATPEDKEKYQTIIKERISTLSNLLEELFFYSKISSQTMVINYEKIDLSELSLRILLSYYEQFKTKEIEPEIRIDEHVMAIVDESFYSRIMQNLIKNVLSHGKEKVIFTLTSEKGVALLTVANLYEDMSLDPSKVFDRFYQSDVNRKNDSSGIGLSVVKKLSQMMNCKVSASVQGDMFEITIKLPVDS